MDTIELLYWTPKILFAATFLFIAFFVWRKKVISTRISTGILCWYIIERAIEIAIRTYLTYKSALDASTSFGKYFSQAFFADSLERVIFQEVLIMSIGAIIWFIFSLYARKTNYEKLDQSDVNLFVFGALISGWPNFLIYIALVFALTCIALLTQMLVAKKTHFIVTPFFALAGIIMVFFGWRLSQLVGLYALR